MLTRVILCWSLGTVGCIAVSACGGSSGGNASPGSSTTIAVVTSTTSPTSALPICGPSQEDCTSDQVIAAVTKYYEIGGGAMPAEAACLAPITGRGTHAVNQAFDQVSADQGRAMIACVGSKVRVETIGNALAKWFGKHPTGIPAQ